MLKNTIELDILQIFPVLAIFPDCWLLKQIKQQTRKLHLQANVSKKVIILHNPSYKLEALGEHRPPWLRQIINPIFPNVIMLNHGGESLTPKILNHYLHHDLGMQQLLWCFFAHLLILEYPDHHQNLISFSLYYPGTLRKISAQSIHNFLSNVVHSQRDRQTNQSYQKHNLLYQGGKNCNVFILYSNSQILQHTSHNQFFNWLPYLVNRFTLLMINDLD